MAIAHKFTHGKPVYGGGAPPATVSKTTTVAYGNLAANAVVFIAEGDRGHHKGRHSYEEFALTGANIKAQNTFFPAGTDLDAKGDTALTAAAGALKLQFEADNTIDRFTFQQGDVMVGFERQAADNYRMTQLFPAAGGENVSKNALRAIRDFLAP